MISLRHIAALLLLTIAGGTAAYGQQRPFVISYWMKTKNDTVSSIRLSDYNTGLMKHVRRVPDGESMTANVQVFQDKAPSETQSYTVTYDEPAELQWTCSANILYTASDGSQHTDHIYPKTTIRVSVETDTVDVDLYSSFSNTTVLQPIVTVSGWNPQTVQVRQSFRIDQQTVHFDYSYEDYGLVKTSSGFVPTPCLQPEMPELVDVNSTELQGEKLGNKVYEVTVRFRQKLTGVHTSENISQDIEYIVKYIAVLENKLISTTYEKDYGWTEAHDNIPPLSHYVLRRIRTYASGEKVVDTFVNPMGYAVETMLTPTLLGYGSIYKDYEYAYNDSIRFVFHGRSADEKNSYFVNIFYCKTGIPDINRLIYHNVDSRTDWEERDLSTYKDVATYSFFYNPDNPVEAWYVHSIERERDVRYDFVAADESYITWIRADKINIRFFDRFLYLDGQVFDFSEYQMTYDFDLREEPMTLTDGSPARVFTHELKAKYLERDYYLSVVDTIYQLPK